MTYLFEVRVSKKIGGVPFKVISVKTILALSSSALFLDSGFAKTKNIVTKKCAHCKEDFEVIYNRMRFCRDACRTKAYYKKKNKGRLLLGKGKCACCGNSFQPLRRGHALCNKPCNTAIMAQKRQREKVYKCKSCKKDFFTDRKNGGVYCGSPCSYEIHTGELKRAKTLAKYKNQKCRVCGKRIMGAYRARLTCNDPCKMNKSVRKMIRGWL